jgi:hypothetical protein
MIDVILGREINDSEKNYDMHRLFLGFVAILLHFA